MTEVRRKYPVDIDSGNEFVKVIKPMVRGTANEFTIGDLGHFAGLFSLGCIGDHEYSLVASMDGVGTMTQRSTAMKEYAIVGESLINHCVNDILTIGAKPLFFLDYIAASRIDITSMSQVVEGLCKAAKENNCPIIGGEIAEMPKVYHDGEYDLAGCIIGIVEKRKILTGKNIEVGDLLIGLPSNGLHTNGYSLVNKLIADGSFKVYGDDGKYTPEYRALYKPHQSYLNWLKHIIDLKIIEAMAHITGGGLDNILRVIPDGMNAKIKAHSWFIPPIFKVIQEAGNVMPEEMFRVYNMGIGMVLVIKPRNLEYFIKQFKQGTWYLIGEVGSGSTKDWEIV